MDDYLATRVLEALQEAEPAHVARTDQLAGLWRDFYAARDLDLADPAIADASLRALTMTYGLLMAAHAAGDIDAAAWSAITEVLASGAAAVTVTRGDEPLAQDPLPMG